MDNLGCLVDHEAAGHQEAFCQEGETHAKEDIVFSRNFSRRIVFLRSKICAWRSGQYFPYSRHLRYYKGRIFPHLKDCREDNRLVGRTALMGLAALGRVSCANRGIVPED